MDLNRGLSRLRQRGDAVVQPTDAEAGPADHEAGPPGGALVPDWRSSVNRACELLSRIPMPGIPLEEPWGLSVATLAGPYLPPPLRRLSQLSDRLGRVRLSPTEVVLDRTSIDWRDVVEIRARSVADALSSYSVDGLAVAIERLLPVTRLAQSSMRSLQDKVNELMLSLLIIALEERADRWIPTQIMHRDRSARVRHFEPSILTMPVLALPDVAECILSTARARNIRVVSMSAPADDTTLEFVRARTAELAMIVARLRATKPSAILPLAGHEPTRLDSR